MDRYNSESDSTQNREEKRNKYVSDATRYLI